MNDSTQLGGEFTLPNTSISLKRMGYGAMRLSGPGIWGPPRDRDGAIAVLREAVDLGINHIDTSDFYGPHVTNQLIREALHPYSTNLTIVSKVGALRGDDKSWNSAYAPQQLTDAVHSNLKNLGLDALDVVNLRLMDEQTPWEKSLETLVELQNQGLIRHLGLSNVSPAQWKKSRDFTEIVCVQNEYNLAQRRDDAFIDELARAGVAYVPFFPLGGFSPLQSATLQKVADSLQASPMQVALAWLLQRAPNILLIPGTSSVEHLRENVGAAQLQIPAEMLAQLNGIADNS